MNGGSSSCVFSSVWRAKAKTGPQPWFCHKTDTYMTAYRRLAAPAAMPMLRLAPNKQTKRPARGGPCGVAGVDARPWRGVSAPVAALQGVSDGDAEKLQAAFNIKTVRDLGTNKFFLWAQAVAKLAE